jgi:hypothetical protein
MVLPEIRLDWWDTVSNQQRTAVLPEHRVVVLPSELSKSVGALPPASSVLPAVLVGVSATGVDISGNSILWKGATGGFALLWLLTLYFYFRKQGPITQPQDLNGSISADEGELLKQFQKACQKGNATLARKVFAQWARNHAPQLMRGSMRDFGQSCGDAGLQAAIDQLDQCGFANDSAGQWQGDTMWTNFKRWKSRDCRPRNSSIGDSPNLYPG